MRATLPSDDRTAQEAGEDAGDEPPPYVLDAQVGYLMRLATQRHAAIFQAHMKADLTPTQFAVLVRLAQVGPSSQNRLGRLAGLDAATVKGVVDRLVAKGLVALHEDATDMRRRRLSLSEEGVAMMPTLHALGHTITEATLTPLNARERATLIRLLDKLT